MHCAQCDDGDKAMIPAQVLGALSLAPRRVCTAAKAYLETMRGMACLSINDFAPTTKARRGKLKKRWRRLEAVFAELKALRRFVEECETLKGLVSERMRGWIGCDGGLTLDECAEVLDARNELLSEVEAFTVRLKQHVFDECEVCGLSRSYSAESESQ